MPDPASPMGFPPSGYIVNEPVFQPDPSTWLPANRHMIESTRAVLRDTWALVRTLSDPWAIRRAVLAALLWMDRELGMGTDPRRPETPREAAPWPGATWRVVVDVPAQMTETDRHSLLEHLVAATNEWHRKRPAAATSGLAPAVVSTARIDPDQE